jgi:hypothetical protein
LQRRREKPAVGAEDRERSCADREADKPCVGGVDDPPAFDLPGGDLELGLLPSVHEPHVAFAPGVQLVLVTERSQIAIGAKFQIVEVEKSLGVERRLVCAAHDQGSVEAALELLGLVDVRVVPERPGVGDDESVLERSARFNRRLHRLRSVHIRGHAEPVPVDRRRLGRLFVNRAWMVSPTSASISGPGTSPLKANPRTLRSGAYAQSISRASSWTTRGAVICEAERGPSRRGLRSTKWLRPFPELSLGRRVAPMINARDARFAQREARPPRLRKSRSASVGAMAAARS